MASPPLLWLLSLVLSQVAVATSQHSKDALLEWFHKQGGKLNSKQEIRLEDPEMGENSRFAIFASDHISKGEVLAYIPWDIVVAPEDYGTPQYDRRQEEIDFDCEVAQLWADEMELGNTSMFLPYLQHLQSQPKAYDLPSQYSVAGKRLFYRIIGGQEYRHIFVDSAITLLVDWAMACGFEEDSISAEAAIQVTKFSFDGLMVPIHDLYTHRNGRYHNTKMTSVTGQYVQIEANRDISNGEQLHSSYDEPENTVKNPAEVLRDHGIVPKYPHSWVVPADVIYVPIETEEGEIVESIVHTDFILFNATQEETGPVEVHLDFPPAHLYELQNFYDYKVKDLNHLKNIELNATAAQNGIPQHEWDKLTELMDAYLGALKQAFHKVHTMIKSETTFFGDEFCVTEGNWDHHYSLFWFWFDDTAYNHADCPTSEWVAMAEYEVLEEEKSNYQALEWKYREEDDDVCLHLDSILQICSGYRPHYHEFFVHYPARYVPSVKRVVFLGSGDAMLLHEILKYPDLVKVVGLELDQQVTRKSFKHFKTQPHYDDPRVEWWYGDATKTLPLLPQDYWGSFDLLLVDLSETVVSLHVTGDHDVLDVISNLLKPEGVMFENELYLHAMSQHFDHAAQIFYGSPKVCTQVQSVSSNKGDFLRSPIYDHGVHTFLIDDVEEPWDRFRYIHDYVDVEARSLDQCSDQELSNATVTEHGRKAGVLLVLEAEDISLTLDWTLAEKIHKVLQMVGLTPLSEQPSRSLKDTVRVVMKEGYVVARPWPNQKYVAFDVALWGAYGKMENIRAALTELVGSKTNSSFRIVVGGMHGSSTWEQDQNEIGVRFSASRGCSPMDLNDKTLVEEEVLYKGIAESIDLLPESNGLSVLVLCGPEKDAVDCVAVESMKGYDDVGTVTPIWSCDGIPEYNNGSEDFKSMIECERNLISALEDHRQTVGEFDMVVVDFSTPSSMLQIFASILGYSRLRWKLMKPIYLVLSPFRAADNHRFRFMHEVRTSIKEGFVSLCEMHFEGQGNQFMGLSILVSGSEHAVYSFASMENALAERLPTTDVRLHAISSGPGHPEIDKKLEERTFRPEDYDMEPAQKQFGEQRPLGRQTIFQLELSDKTATMPSLDALSRFLKISFQSIDVHNLEDIEIVENVGDGGVLLSRFESGDVILTWDGDDHVDINLFVLGQTKATVDLFLESFLGQTQGQLTRTLRDDYPRGTGRVVNFQHDIDREAP